MPIKLVILPTVQCPSKGFEDKERCSTSKLRFFHSFHLCSPPPPWCQPRVKSALWWLPVWVAMAINIIMGMEMLLWKVGFSSIRNLCCLVSQWGQSKSIKRKGFLLQSAKTHCCASIAINRYHSLTPQSCWRPITKNAPHSNGIFALFYSSLAIRIITIFHFYYMLILAPKLWYQTSWFCILGAKIQTIPKASIFSKI